MTALLRIFAWAIALALVALPVVALVNGWIGAERWPLRTLRLQGDLQRVDAQRVRAIVLPHARRGFFAMRLSDAQAEIARLPWVERAEVHKRWPDVVEVRIVEHKPYALWGEDRLLSEQGRIFPRSGVVPPKGLPRLSGPDARVADVVALYNQSHGVFAHSGLDVRSLALDSRGSWSLQLSNGADVVVGSSQARSRIERFARLLPQLMVQKTSPLQRADLRYTNGFALTWGLKRGLGAGGLGLEEIPVRTVRSTRRNSAAMQPRQRPFPSLRFASQRQLPFPSLQPPFPSPGSPT